MRNTRNIILYTFTIVFLAELGDKTQIAGFSLTAQTGNTVSVIIGASFALIASTLIAVLVGNKLASVIPQRIVRIVSALLFMGAGAVMLISNLPL